MRFVLLLFWATSVAAQGPSVTFKQCREPKVPLGVLRAQGIVTYQADRDGRPDTSTVRVADPRNISAAGFRSAVVRFLSACRLALDPKPDAAVSILQQFTFDSTRVRFAPGGTPPTMEERRDSTPLPAGPVDDTASVLEERPRELGCRNGGPRESVISVQARTRADAEAAIEAQMARDTGTVEARYVVGPDGRMVEESFSVVASTNLGLARQFSASVKGCRWAPGRIAGVPVATKMTVRFQSGLGPTHH
jgi:hypothetical protein